MLTIDPIRKLSNIKIIRYANKFTLPIPDPFIEANNLHAKEEVEVYRERINDRDALIIIPKGSTPVPYTH